MTLGCAVQCHSTSPASLVAAALAATAASPVAIVGSVRSVDTLALLSAVMQAAKNCFPCPEPLLLGPKVLLAKVLLVFFWTRANTVNQGSNQD